MTISTITHTIGNLTLTGTMIEGVGVLVNMTPHTINVLGTNSNLELPPSGATIRVDTAPNGLYHKNDLCPIFDRDIVGTTQISDGTTTIDEMPFEENGLFFIVSGIVSSHLKGRGDILVPRTSPSENPVRNEKGWITAVRGLKMVY